MKYLGEIYWGSILHTSVNVWELSLVWVKTHPPPFSWSPEFRIFWLYPCLVCPDLQSLCPHRALAGSVPCFQRPGSRSIRKACLLALAPPFLLEPVCSKGKCGANKYFSPPVYVLPMCRDVYISISRFDKWIFKLEELWSSLTNGSLWKSISFVPAVCVYVNIICNSFRFGEKHL